MKLNGLTAIISGANQGFGLAVAKEFVQQGANVMLCARNKDLLAKACEALLALTEEHRVRSMQADVTDMQAMEALAETAIATFGRIDILVANAGVYGTKGPIDAVDWQAWSDAIDINLKGTVWQCRAVLPYLKKQARGKIIILSGGGATRPLPNLSAYAASKAGVVRFAETLAAEVVDFHIDVNAVAPGALNTQFLDEILAAGPEKVGEVCYEQAVKQKQSGGTPLEVGAELCTFLASCESDGISGRLISALWDPWKKLPKYVDELHRSDIYTIRRIVPKDRGYDWDDKN